ncbi:uncharacterized protein BDV17DRAFT_272243 [Aspergillus undulatus]|uniref:uncharacterized protein n=1 Tax=Aspergillus undulatus TaxID=1810928 RepID=UPI003CCD937F
MILNERQDQQLECAIAVFIRHRRRWRGVSSNASCLSGSTSTRPLFRHVWLALRDSGLSKINFGVRRKIECCFKGSTASFVKDDLRHGATFRPLEAAKRNRVYQAWRQEKSKEEEEAWTVYVMFQDTAYNRTNMLGRAKCGATIGYYDGEKVVTSLPVFPCRFTDSLDGGEELW